MKKLSNYVGFVLGLTFLAPGVTQAATLSVSASEPVLGEHAIVHSTNLSPALPSGGVPSKLFVGTPTVGQTFKITMLENQANEVARRIIKLTNLHMNLENQQTDTEFVEEQIKKVTEELIHEGSKQIWKKK